ncbi:cytoplasmic protein [Macrolepiota fuliginosa MF-IS2]|uniref:Cytoplasmic protein n=1 Tax=Macrolepiota fuliginosa MF-IS2 TaxID=1400762 RepID=A0A9P5XJN9_9AGAR|nr:cytoplasmic protein [Macrolepiota fuliginosa MF-IS2]
MYRRNSSAPFLLLLLAALSIYYSPALSQELEAREGNHIFVRDGDHHHHTPYAQPLLELNETEILMKHSPTPPSYYTIDWEDPENATTRHPGLIISHALFMGLAFFIALPMGIILRSVKHAGHSVATVAFYGLSVIGCAASALYTKLTPNMYEGSVHGKHGYMVLFLAVLLSAIDILAAMRRFICYVRSDEPKSIKLFWSQVVLNQDIDRPGRGPEYTGLIVEESEELELHKISQESDNDDLRETAQWANDVHNHRRNYSMASDGTVFGSRSPTYSDVTLQEKFRRTVKSKSLIFRIGHGVFAVLERFLVVAGFAQVLTGIVIYTGGCRENYQNGCLAHLIKGGIFWCYGLLTFARFLGSYAHLGWAWNRAPIGDPYSAEFIESFVIFLYGVTNTWMERFGANPGDPFTTKEIQHISIAIMFWFAGLIGMGIESKLVRKWLAASIFSSVATPSNVPQDTITEPPSYGASFNPFPALVIGVTGAAMAAHFQTYLFQVQIHALWGNLLVGFAVLRCLTYLFLWLAPPRSILPSRPPTEALGSFFLACGGLVFMFSTEEITLAAMRRGRDDVMMFLNVAVAITCLAFCWIILVVGFKGWLKSRQYTGVTYRTAA